MSVQSYIMDVRQLSLWDNVSVEKGYEYLASLQLEEAIECLTEALNDAGDKNMIEKDIETAVFWRLKLSPFAKKEPSTDSIKELLDDFICYDFPSPIKKFKMELLIRLVNWIIGNKSMHWDDMEGAFNQLLMMDSFQKAEELAVAAIHQYPRKYFLLYFLAQAQWLNNKETEANGNYLRALLYYPDKIFLNRIENTALRNAAEQHGMAEAPAYAWIKGIVGFTTPQNDIEPLDTIHQISVRAYSLLKQSEDFLKTDNLKESIRCRKELKHIEPDLYKAYFSLLEQRKR